MSSKNASVGQPGFEELIPNYNDEELINVLKKRSDYRKEAVALALSEALKRGIIGSEEELLEERFQDEKAGFTWFPMPQIHETRQKIRSSIIRSLVIAGLISFFYGILLLYRKEGSHAELIASFGFVWTVITLLLNRKHRFLYIVLLLAADALAGIALIVRLVQERGLPIDFFIVVVFVLMVIYGVIFLHQIDKHSQSK